MTETSPFNFQRSKYTEDARPIVAADWSAKRVDATFDGINTVPFTGLDALVDYLEQPHKIVMESTLESFDSVRRAAAIARARNRGHEIYVYRPSNTARERAELGWDKSDANDARVIHNIATQRVKHVYPVPTPFPEWVARRAELNAQYLLIRGEGDKPELAAHAIRVLGPFGDLPEEFRTVLGSKGYSQTIMAVMAFAAPRSATRDEFERLLGLHGSAYPTLIRAEVLTHSWRHAHKRGADWSTYRRVLRRVYRQLHNEWGLEIQGPNPLPKRPAA